MLIEMIKQLAKEELPPPPPQSNQNPNN